MDLEQLIAQTLAKVLEKKVDAVLGGKTEQEVEDTDSVEIESVDRTDLESNAKSTCALFFGLVPTFSEAKN